MMERYLLGIDVGTTGTKTLLFSESGSLIARAYRDYPLHTPQVGWREQHAEDWWQAVVDTVREVCATEEITRHVAAISLSTQGGTVVPTDKFGNPVRNAVVWSDNRCSEQRSAFAREAGGDAAMYHTTGWHLGSGLPAMSLLWMKEQEPQIFSEAAMFLTVPDYLSLKMTGIAAVDMSNAGINQLCDIRQNRYDKNILDYIGISEHQLPKLVHSGQLIGHLTAAAASELGLGTEVVLVAGAHDQYAVALGAGAVHHGDILIGSGTAWVVTAIADEPDFESNLSQSVAAVPGKWGSLRSLASGGVCLDWLRKQVGATEEMSYSIINETLPSRRAAEDGLFFFPFSGKAGPGRSFRKATFTGLDLSHDCYHMAKAVMEGVVFQTLWMMEAFRTKPSEDGIILAGGASKSTVWSQLLADISGLPVRIPEVADLACVGAAVMAGTGCGVFPDSETGCRRLAVNERRVLPHPDNTKMYAPLFASYKRQAEMLVKLYEE